MGTWREMFLDRKAQMQRWVHSWVSRRTTGRLAVEVVGGSEFKIKLEVTPGQPDQRGR